MKYKVGDKVKIKSIDWYNENKDYYGAVYAGNGCVFWNYMAGFCGEIMTISTIKVDPEDSNKGYYFMVNSGLKWTDEMIEGLVEEEILIEKVDDRGLPFNEWLSHKGAFYIPEGYVLKDENGNEISTNKIILEKIKKEYPKTYEECAKVLLDRASVRNDFGYKGELLVVLQKLLVCRAAYWKIAGEEMGLDGPWKPDFDNENEYKYGLFRLRNIIYKDSTCINPTLLIFPTEEMRDAFYENFNEEIEQCKELL